jgi:hypothetical protein
VKNKNATLKEYYFDMYPVYGGDNILVFVNEDGVLPSGFPDSLTYVSAKFTKMYKKMALHRTIKGKAFYCKDPVLKKNFLGIPLREKYNSEIDEFRYEFAKSKIITLAEKEGIKSFSISSDNINKELADILSSIQQDYDLSFIISDATPFTFFNKKLNDKYYAL